MQWENNVLFILKCLFILWLFLNAIFGNVIKLERGGELS